MATSGKGKKDSKPTLFTARLRVLLGSLPLLKKLFPPPASPEPFASIEDAASKLDALAEPNAIPLPERKERRAKRPRLDPSALLAALIKRPLLLALTSALLLLALLVALSSFLVSAPPKPLPELRGPTQAGEALAGKLLLPEDPALLLSAELESEPKAVYTEEDISRLRPLIDEELRKVDASALAEVNDREARALFEAVP